MFRIRFRRMLGVAIAVGLIIGLQLAALPAAAAPMDGNGNKVVVQIDDTGIPIDCAGETIWLDAAGWFQVKEFKGKGNRNIELAVFHINLTFYNADGDTFHYLDVGPDHAYLDGDGNFVFSIVGRPGNAGGEGFSLRGRMVVNTGTGEVTWHGNTGPTDEDMACAALTG